MTGTKGNKFVKINNSIDLDSMGLELVSLRQPLLDKYKIFEFKRIDGTIINHDDLLTTILRKK